MTPAELLARCAATRAQWNAAAEASPAYARAMRADAARRGWTSAYDDPGLTVRCSDLEALAYAALGTTPPPAHPDHPPLFEL